MRKNNFFGDTVVVFITQMLNVILMFLINILATKTFGTELYGEYIYWFTILNFVMIFCKFGLDQGVIAYLPKVRKRKEVYNSIITFVYLFSCVISLIIGVGVFLFYLSKNDTISLFNYILLFVPIITIIEVSSGIFRVSNLIKKYVLIKNIIMNVLQIFTIIGFEYIDLKNNYGLLLVFIISNFISFILILLNIKRSGIVSKIKKENFNEYRNLIKLSVPLLLASLFAITMTKIDIIFIGNFLTNTDVAMYNAIIKIANLSLFVISVVNITLIPTLSQLHYDGEKEKFIYVYKTATKVVFVISLIFLGAIILFGSYALSIFDKSFVDGYIPLIIVSIANVISSAIGSTGYINVIYGESKIEMYNTLIAVIVSFIVNLILIPKVGIVGAASAFLLASLVLNGMRLFITKKRYGIQPLDKQYFVMIFLYISVICVIVYTFTSFIIYCVGYIAITIVLISYFIKTNKFLYKYLKEK